MRGNLMAFVAELGARAELLSKTTRGEELGGAQAVHEPGNRASRRMAHAGFLGLGCRTCGSARGRAAEIVHGGGVCSIGGICDSMNQPPTAFGIWWTVVKREYVTRVRRRAFLLATLLGPVLWVGMVAGLVLLTQSTEEPVKVWVADHDGLLTVPEEGGQFVPLCPSCYPERSLLTYRFGKEVKTGR